MSHYDHLIYTNTEKSLDSIPHHEQVLSILRLAPQNFPFHTAIHCISQAAELEQRYVELHQHEVPEINIFIPGSADFCFEVQLGDETHFITEHSSIWIPPGLKHAANIRVGQGYFICLILAPTEQVMQKTANTGLELKDN